MIIIMNKINSNELLLSSNAEDSDNNATNEKLLSLSSNNESDRENYPYGQIIVEAYQHAEEAQQQHHLVKICRQTGYEKANEPHENRRFVSCCCFVFYFIYNHYPFIFLIVVTELFVHQMTWWTLCGPRRLSMKQGESNPSPADILCEDTIQSSLSPLQSYLLQYYLNIRQERRSPTP
jgi:hypothetical protein